MLYKNIVVVWSNDPDTLEIGVRAAIRAAESSDDRGDVLAYSEDGNAVPWPPADANYNPSVSEAFTYSEFNDGQ